MESNFVAGRADIEIRPYDGQSAPRNVRTKHRRGAFHMPPPFGIPLCNRRRTPEPALCKGRCRAKRGGGVVPDTNYLLFLFCKLQNFTIPQALTRQLPLHKGAFLVCANIAGDLLPQGAAVTMHRLLGENPMITGGSPLPCKKIPTRRELPPGGWFG